MIVVPAEQKRLVPIRGRHQHLRRRRNRQNLKIAEVLAEFAGRHDSDRRHVLALSARFPPDDYLLAIVPDETDATDVLVLLVAVDDVLEEDGVDLGHVFDVDLPRLEEQRDRRRCGNSL